LVDIAGDDVAGVRGAAVLFWDVVAVVPPTIA
jgi:hypothetical protein